MQRYKMMKNLRVEFDSCEKKSNTQNYLKFTRENKIKKKVLRSNEYSAPGGYVVEEARGAERSPRGVGGGAGGGAAQAGPRQRHVQQAPLLVQPLLLFAQRD